MTTIGFQRMSLAGEAAANVSKDYFRNKIALKTLVIFVCTTFDHGLDTYNVSQSHPSMDGEKVTFRAALCVQLKNNQFWT